MSQTVTFMSSLQLMKLIVVTVLIVNFSIVKSIQKYPIIINLLSWLFFKDRFFCRSYLHLFLPRSFKQVPSLLCLGLLLLHLFFRFLPSSSEVTSSRTTCKLHNHVWSNGLSLRDVDRLVLQSFRTWTRRVSSCLFSPVEGYWHLRLDSPYPSINLLTLHPSFGLSSRTLCLVYV